MKFKRVFLVVTAVATSSCFSCWANSAAPASVARETVQTIIDKASTLDQKATRAENARTIENLVDFDRLTNDAMGSHLDAATKPQRAEIRDLLKRIITRTVYPEAPQFFRDVKVQFTNEEKSGRETHITSLVTKGQKRSTVEYWLIPSAAGYQVIDLAIEGERWVENVRDQFDALITKKGVPGLIARLKKRAAELSVQTKS